MVVNYVALRSLVGGVSVNDSIVRDLQAFDLVEGRNVERSEQVAISGARQITYDRGENTWNVTHIPIVIGSTDEIHIRMFLDSVESGQVFSFSPYDESTDSPIAYRNVQVTSKGWTADRVLKKGGATRGASDYVQHSFMLVEVP